MIKNRHLLAYIAILSVPISGISIDIYVPSMPAVADYFAVDKSLVQLTITLYMLGYGFMQLFAGALVDSWGRKTPYIVATLVFALASLGITFASSIHELLFLRFVQGSMVAFINVPMRAVLSDLFTGKDYYKKMNLMNIAWSIGPIVAPAIGGYLQHYFGWRSPFYLLALYSLTNLVLNIIFIPETIKEYHPLHLEKVLHRYKLIFQHLEFLDYLLTIGLIYTFMIFFSVIGPFLLQTVMHYSAIEFGHIALLMGLGWFIGNTANRFLLEFELPHKRICCYLIMLITAIAMAIFSWQMPLNVYVIIIPTWIIMVAGGVLFPDIYANSVNLFPNASAPANAILGAFLVLIASAGSAIAAMLNAQTEEPLVLSYLILAIVCLGLHLLSLRLAKTR